MKPSKDLHQLIKSMSMSEKRHFKLYSAGHINGETKNYLRLFDAIDKQERYDEEEIKSVFDEEVFVKHLPSQKNYLYQNLLESLNAFNKEKTFLARHSNYFISIEILFNRGLFSQCRKIIRKAKAEAYELEKYSLLLLIIRWETLIYINDENEYHLNKGMEEELRILEIMKAQTTLMKIAFNIQTRIDKGNVPDAFLQEKLDALKSNYPSRRDLQTFWVNYYFQSGRALIYTVQNKHLKRLECFTQIKSIMDRSSQFIKDIPSVYNTNYNNLVNVMCFLGKYEEAKSILHHQKEFLRKYGIKRAALSKIVFLNTYESELFLAYKTRKISHGALLVKSIEQQVSKIDIHFNPVLFDLKYMMAVCELMRNDFKGATKWLNQILNAERDVNLRKEVRINARLLYTIALFESQDRLLENRINSTRRFIVQEPEFKTSLKILEAIRILSDPKLMKNKKAEVPKLINQIRKESRRANEEALNKQFDFAEWLEGKMN